MSTTYVIGIDMSKKDFQACLTCDGINFSEDSIINESSSIASYFRGLRSRFGFSFKQLIVCLEHTGIYSNPLLGFLVRHKVKVCMEPAMQIKQSQGMVRGKSDQIDARRIALYAFKNRENLPLWEPPREILQRLRALLTVRDRMVKMRVQLSLPLKEIREYVSPSISKMLDKATMSTRKVLSRDISRLDEEIQSLIKSDKALQEQYQQATSVPGIGPITALQVIISTGEFKRISEAKKFACYAGVAPFEHTSGSSIRGKTRVSKMANMGVKKLLHMAAVTAVRHSGELRDYYERKVAEGKNKMSVLNAVRNKLITRLFMCIKQQRLYQKDYQSSLV
jgi:transposase